MKAVRIYAYGGPEALVLDEIPEPVPGEGEVVIAMQAASVNQTDIAYRVGYMAAYIPLTFPATLGLDVAGKVVSTGKGVTNVKVGDAVYTRTDFSRLGGYAEYVVVAAADVVQKPDSLSYAEASCLPHVGITAWRGLVDAVGISAGQTILIHGAAGGLGTVAIQLAKSRGAYVIGTSSANHLDYLKGLGADEAFDYTSSAFENKYRDIDVVYDAIGGETLQRSYKMVKKGGHLISVMETPVADKLTELGIKGAMAAGYPPVAPVLEEMNRLVKAGKLKPVVTHLLPLSEARQAQEMLETHHMHGKVVLHC